MGTDKLRSIACTNGVITSDCNTEGAAAPRDVCVGEGVYDDYIDPVQGYPIQLLQLKLPYLVGMTGF